MIDYTFVGEIRIYAGDTAPAGWAFCNGQLMDTNSNTALFSLLGHAFGGGGNKFALPDLRSRVAVGTAADRYHRGERGGQEVVSLSPEHIPAHSHMLQTVDAPANSPNPGNNFVARSANMDIFYQEEPSRKMNQKMIGATGGGQPHPNRQPTLGIQFIIALQGIFPPRT